jgi:FAD:protein FMN transferase
VTERFRSMGCEVVVAGGDAPHARQLFDDDDRRFTRFAADSELQRVNAAPGPVLVSPRFARALRAALAAMRQTDGLVDPALLDALEAAGYDRDFDALVADPRPARQPLPRPAHRRAGRIRLTGKLLTRPARTRLDLNGVVKSMAVDDALAVTGAEWVSAGGDLATRRPLEVALPGGGSIRLERGALATSGSAARRWLHGGELQHHLIDPRTGRPALSPWEQVTACGATCLMADVAAKAAFLLGDAGPSWLDARGMPGRFLRRDGSAVVNQAWEQACI